MDDPRPSSPTSFPPHYSLLPSPAPDSLSALSYFPFPIIRPVQRDLLFDMDYALGSGRILLANAPTGLGKTACALASALHQAGRLSKKVFFLTSRHTQHRLAIDTLAMIKRRTSTPLIVADLLGKKNLCLQSVADLFGSDFNEYCRAITEKSECAYFENTRSHKKLTPQASLALKELIDQSPQHVSDLTALSSQQNFCPYELVCALCEKAQVIICDYNYIFQENVRGSIFSRLNISLEDCLIIIDEAHNLPGRIQEMLSVQLTSFTLKNALHESKKFHFTQLSGYLSHISNILTQLSDFSSNVPLSSPVDLSVSAESTTSPSSPKRPPFNLKSNSQLLEKTITKQHLISKIEEKVPYDILLSELLQASSKIREQQRRSFVGSVALFLSSWSGSDEGYIRLVQSKSTRFGPLSILSYRCLDASLISRPIFDQIPAGILMSGTLNPPFMFKDILSVDRAILKEYPSPFPPNNRLSLVIPQTSTKYTLRTDETYVSIAKKCQELDELVPGNIAFFFPSYDLRDRILQYFTSSKEIFVETPNLTSQQKENLISGFYLASSRRGGALLGVTGANFAEGVDFPGHLLQAVIVVGVPLSRIDLSTTALIDYYTKKFGRGWEYGYIYPAISKSIQCAGRCIRQETDRGLVVFLDERFASPTYFSCLPREGLRLTTNYRSLISSFFSDSPDVPNNSRGSSNNKDVTL